MAVKNMNIRELIANSILQNKTTIRLNGTNHFRTLCDQNTKLPLRGKSNFQKQTIDLYALEPSKTCIRKRFLLSRCATS